ncbi:hypothetical protein WBG99_03675 [Streptomyces sp. TG1A-60]|uniref:hypothetical protein n=1 Tax=Streptomyces sp. TG1A-60 TaxID=3129111 RepID=UPI0030D5BF79
MQADSATTPADSLSGGRCDGWRIVAYSALAMAPTAPGKTTGDITGHYGPALVVLTALPAVAALAVLLARTPTAEGRPGPPRSFNVLDLRRRSAEGLAQRPGRMEQVEPALP